MRWIGLPLAVFALALAHPARGADPTDHFEAKVRPILVQQCIKCHGPDKQKGGLRLDSKPGWQTGGENGPALKPGKPDDSLLIKAVRGADGTAQMPPNAKLSAAEVAALVQWVKDGAADPRDGGPARLGGVTVAEAKKWWSFQPVTRPAVPKTATNPIDAFILAKLADQKLTLSPPADKRTLIRRATYDLTGLPPTAGGGGSVREGRVAGGVREGGGPAARVAGLRRALGPALARPRPLRRHRGREQRPPTAARLALPQLGHRRVQPRRALRRVPPRATRRRRPRWRRTARPEKYAPRVVATGFLAVARRFGHEIEKDIHLTHEDTIDTVGKAFLGLTIGCARCHDHKYDADQREGLLRALRHLRQHAAAVHRVRASAAAPRPRPARDPGRVGPRGEATPGETRAPRCRHQGRDRRPAAHAQETQAAFAKNRKMISQGEIPDGGDKAFDGGEIEVNAGEMILLSVTPLKNHGADTTLVEFELTEVGGRKRRWSATDDLVPDLLAGNPHADGHGHANVWWLFDARNQPTLLPEAVRDISGKAGLHAWRNGETPSVLVTSAKDDVTVWTKLPARSLFVHPAPNGNVAIGWLSPVTGKVAIKGRIEDAHPGGPDGVAWVLERFAVDVRKPLLGQLEAAAKIPALMKERAELAKAAPAQDVAFAVAEGDPARREVAPPRRPGEARPGRAAALAGSVRRRAAPREDRQRATRTRRVDCIEADNPLTARVMVEPRLAAPLRQGPGEDAERLRYPRQRPDAPGVARLARGGVRSRRLEHEGAAPPDHALRDLPASERDAPGRREGGREQ